MRTLALITAIVAAACSTLPATGATYTVDPSGGGDFATLPLAFWYVGWPDTVELVPGVHAAGGGAWGWPIELNSSSPCAVGQEGADATVLLGDGVTSAFLIQEYVFDARMDFRGITFRNLGELFARSGETQIGGGALQFIDNVVENCGSDRALDAQNCPSGSGLISGCRIIDNPGFGIFTYHFGGTVEECEIARNGRDGICGVCCEEPTIRQNHIHHNDWCGISPSWYYTVEYNLIEENGTSGICILDQGTFRHNVIRGNPVGIEHWGTLGTIHGNDIHENDLYNVRFTASSVRDIDLTMNWWGTTDPDEIAASIWDCHDDPAVRVCVIFDPWCWSPGCTGTAVQPTLATWGAIKALYR